MPSLTSIRSGYNKIYQPSIDLITKQMNELPLQSAGQIAGLNQEKINTFRDIDESANAANKFYSGYRPSEQFKYLGVNYLPKLAQIKTGETQQRYSLLQTLNDLISGRSKDILNRYDTLTANAAQNKLEKKKLAQSGRLGQAEINAILQAAKIRTS